jgi:hypothetical protein
MSYLTTGLDLKLDALGMAGEPSDGTSSYTDQQVYEWLTVTERAIVSGGFFGPSILQPAEWFWARAWPRGAIQMVQPFNAAGTATATFTAGSRTVRISVGVPDLTGFRIFRPDIAARHLIDSIGQTPAIDPAVNITLREPWTGDSDATTSWLAYPDTYQLPADFLHGCSPLFMYSFPSNLPWQSWIDVIDPTDMERIYPQTYPWAQGAQTTVGGGVPMLAARVTDTRIRFSHFLNTPNSTNPMQLEFEYIRRPNVIAEGTIPLVPIEHRRILSYGAAFLILDDKKSSQMNSMWAHFEAAYKAMRDELTRDMRRMSTRFGVVQPARASGSRSIMLTETGLPVYIW